MNHADTPTTKLPPLAKGWPLLGSLFPLMREPLYFFFKQYEELGPIFRVEVLGRKLTVLAGPEVNQLLTKHDHVLDNKSIWVPVLDDLGAVLSPGLAEGATLARVRKLLKTSFGPDTVFQNIPTMLALTREALASHEDGATVEVTLLMQQLVATQLGFLTNDRVPGEHFADITTYWNAMINVFISDRRPARHLRSAAVVRSRERVQAFARAVVERRRSLAPEERNPINLVDNLLAAQEQDPDFVTDEDILFNSLLPYFAGIDTAAGTAAFLIYELLTHPQLLGQVEEEVEALFADEGPTKAKLKLMPTLKAALQETLRLYPIGGLLKRRLHEDITYEGYALKAGQLLLVANGSPHLSKAFYTDPYRFDHARFLPPRNEHRGHKGIYAPYGAGPHTCLGAALAEAQIMLSVSTLLHEAQFELADSSYTLQTKMDPGLLPKNFQVRVRVR